MTHPAFEPDNVAKRHLRGSALLLSGRMISLAAGFAVQVATVRYLSKADYGVYAFALAVTAIAAVISACGMDKTASRFLPVYLENRDYRRFWGAFGLLLATVMGVGMLIAALLVGAWALNFPALSSDPRTLAVLAIVAGLAVCEALDALFISLFAVLGNPKAIFLRQHVLGPAFKLLAAAAVILASGDLYAFAVGQTIAGLLSVAICLRMVVRILAQNQELRQSLSLRPQFPAREIYGYSVMLLIGDLSYLLRGSIVPVVLGTLFLSEEVASFQAVAPVARMNELALMTFSVLFLPGAAKLAAARRHAELQHLYEKTLLWITLLSYPIFAVSMLAPSAVAVFLFGASYRESGSILAWLAVGYFTNAAFGSSLRLLRASAPPRVILGVDLFVVAAGLGLVACLVPRYGALGGAWAVCGAYMVQAVAYQIAVRKCTQVNSLHGRLFAPYLVGLGLAIALGQIQQGLRVPAVYGFGAALLASLIMLLAFTRRLELPSVFPELVRLPLVGRWLHALRTPQTTVLKPQDSAP